MVIIDLRSPTLSCDDSSCQFLVDSCHFASRRFGGWLCVHVCDERNDRMDDRPEDMNVETPVLKAWQMLFPSAFVNRCLTQFPIR